MWMYKKEYLSKLAPSMAAKSYIIAIIACINVCILNVRLLG